MDSQEIIDLIQTGLPDAQITLKDLAGDGDHFAAHIVSKQFIGKTRIQQHQIVYQALQGKMGTALHALALETACPGI